jgi:hypothetical protein
MKNDKIKIYVISLIDKELNECRNEAKILKKSTKTYKQIENAINFWVDARLSIQYAILPNEEQIKECLKSDINL